MIDEKFKVWMYRSPEDGEPKFSFTHPMFTKAIPLFHQPDWVGLTEEELNVCLKKHKSLKPVYYDKANDTSIIGESFDGIGFYDDIERILKEKNT
jgi:hypothetical protein